MQIFHAKLNDRILHRAKGAAPDRLCTRSNTPALGSPNASRIASQRSPRKLAAGRTSGLVMAALRSLGPRHVTSVRVTHLRNLLKPKDRHRLLKDLRFAPAWMHPHLRMIAGERATT